MRVSATRYCRVEWEWSLPMIPWHRQLISPVYGLGVVEPRGLTDTRKA